MEGVTEADLAAGARSAASEAAPGVPPGIPAEEPIPEAPAAAAQPNVAETMVQESPGAREATTLMPAWQPPPAAPAPPAVPETMRMAPVPDASGPAGPQAELNIESGPDAGHTHRAGDHALRLGRSPDNDVILRDPATSGHHARVEQRGDQFWIVDLGSTNGTYVNGEAVQEKQLNSGDRVTLGQNSVHFTILGA